MPYSFVVGGGASYMGLPGIDRQSLIVSDTISALTSAFGARTSQECVAVYARSFGTVPSEIAVKQPAKFDLLMAHLGPHVSIAAGFDHAIECRSRLHMAKRTRAVKVPEAPASTPSFMRKKMNHDPR
jgi:hypothetical protein